MVTGFSPSREQFCRRVNEDQPRIGYRHLYAKWLAELGSFSLSRAEQRDGTQAGRYIPEAQIIRAAHDGKFIAETKFFHCGSANEVCSWLPCV